MKIFIPSILFLLFAASWNAVRAQTISVETQYKTNVCGQESFEKIEKSYNQRQNVSSEWSGRVEQNLKKFIADCGDTAFYYQAEAYLKIVQEEKAEHIFFIARYYWNKFQNGEGGRNGARARLKQIIEKYPNYSQIISVKLLLDEADKVDF